MDKSLVGEYFGFEQALEFLKDGYKVTNEYYNPNYYFFMDNGEIRLGCGNKKYHGIESIDIYDILSEKWFIYDA